VAKKILAARPPSQQLRRKEAAERLRLDRSRDRDCRPRDSNTSSVARLSVNGQASAVVTALPSSRIAPATTAVSVKA